MTHQSYEIRELENEQEWIKAFSIMKQLRTQLDEDSYLELVKEATQ